jgi:hypothetical protein
MMAFDMNGISFVFPTVCYATPPHFPLSPDLHFIRLGCIPAGHEG